MKRNKNLEERWMKRKQGGELEKMKKRLNSDVKRTWKKRKKENKNMNRKCKLDNQYSLNGKKKGGKKY